jgi:hypothetical protein
VLAVVSLYLVSGVVLRQGLGARLGRSASIFPVWQMFSGSGLGLSQVRYFEQDQADGRREIDRYETMGVERLDQPRGVWRVHGTDGARRLGKKLCRALGPGARVELELRTGTRRGWRPEPPVADVCGAEETSSP